MDEVRHTIPLRLEHILERDGFNVRPELRDIDELKESIRTMGVLYPPLVVRARDRDPISETEAYYYVIYGHRRVRAMKALGWSTGHFFVANPDISFVDQLVLNLTENIRQDISKAEIADRCLQIIEAAKRNGRTVTSDELAPSIGYSASYLRQLMQLRRDLHPELWDVMVRRGNRAPVRKLSKISRLPQHEQLDAWKVAAEAIEEEARDEAGDEKKAPLKGPPRPKKVSWRSIAADLVKEAPPEYASGARWFLEELGARLGRADILRALSE